MGTALMDYAIKWARRRRVEKIVLRVFSANSRAAELYFKFGFVAEGVRKKFMADGKCVDEALMGLFL